MIINSIFFIIEPKDRRPKLPACCAGTKSGLSYHDDIDRRRCAGHHLVFPALRLLSQCYSTSLVYTQSQSMPSNQKSRVWNVDQGFHALSRKRICFGFRNRITNMGVGLLFGVNQVPCFSVWLPEGAILGSIASHIRKVILSATRISHQLESWSECVGTFVQLMFKLGEPVGELSCTLDLVVSVSGSADTKSV